MRACTAELARKVDEARRARIRAENARAEVALCPECEMPASDWTPGCSKCWSRQRSRQRRGSDRFDARLAARMRIWVMQMHIDHGRKRLNGHDKGERAA